MKITLDTSVCTGHGRCYTLAPEVFDEDDRGHCVLKLEALPEALRESARGAVDACPEQALSLSPD
jgi:ferredoxin